MVLSPESLTAADIEANLGAVAPATWPARHRLHKYWGKKPCNVVSAYIEFFSRPGETVLDPFCGSGVTPVEATLMGRRGLGCDLNPFAVRLTAALLDPPDPRRLDAAGAMLVDKLRAEALRLYGTRCRGCAGQTAVRSFAYEGQTLTAVRYACSLCGNRAECPPDEDDIRRSHSRRRSPISTPDGPLLAGWQMRKLLAAKVRTWGELFTPRNRRMAGLLLREIEAVSEARVREWLLLSLTAGLAQMTRMIADYQGAAGGPSWKINCYWLPERWQELNALHYFENRVRKSVRAAKDLGAMDRRKLSGRAVQSDAGVLAHADGSVDYIFTDPPYGGEGIQYAELSALWCLWLREESALDGEIAFNPVRGLDQNAYDQRLSAAAAEMYRVLKPGRWCTVTFANKDEVVWNGLLEAWRKAGFELRVVVPLSRSAPALTETTMPRAPKADLVLSFQKPGRRRRRRAAKPVAVAQAQGS